MMAQHFNPSISERARRILNTKGDSLPSEVEGPVAVIMLSPVCRIVRNGQQTTTGGFTVYTTPSDKDFYLVAATLSLVKDATCDIASGRNALQIIVDGVQKDVMAIALLTLTAQASTITLTFNPPIKVDRNTAISNGGTTSFTVGAMSRSTQIVGYTEEHTAT